MRVPSERRSSSASVRRLRVSFQLVRLENMLGFQKKSESYFMRDLLTAAAKAGGEWKPVIVALKRFATQEVWQNPYDCQPHKLRLLLMVAGKSLTPAAESGFWWRRIGGGPDGQRRFFPEIRGPACRSEPKRYRASRADIHATRLRGTSG